jgi:hypothetical protein
MWCHVHLKHLISGINVEMLLKVILGYVLAVVSLLNCNFKWGSPFLPQKAIRPSVMPHLLLLCHWIGELLCFMTFTPSPKMGGGDQVIPVSFWCFAERNLGPNFILQNKIENWKKFLSWLGPVNWYFFLKLKMKIFFISIFGTWLGLAWWVFVQCRHSQRTKPSVGHNFPRLHHGCHCHPCQEQPEYTLCWGCNSQFIHRNC